MVGRSGFSADGLDSSLDQSQRIDGQIVTDSEEEGKTDDEGEAKTIDEYANLKTKAAEANDDSAVIDPRLEAIVERMLDKCILDRKYQQAIGMAIECGRLNKLEEAVLRSDNVHSIINYCMVVSHSFVNRREYQLKHLSASNFLDEPESVAIILEELLRSENLDDALLAFQIAFDLVENEHQAFLLKVRDRLPSSKSQPSEPTQYTVAGVSSARFCTN
ncbi:26S proteasome regulatory complex [Perilla frutescens var. frutescens]|nr:26S proteasome regulatory complex [Perilla frutescens var. frutescens]